MKHLFITSFILTVILSTIAENSIAQAIQSPQDRLNLIAEQLEFALDIESSYHNRNAKDLLIQADVSIKRAQRQILAGHGFRANRLLNNASHSIRQAMKLILKDPQQEQEKKIRQLIGEAQILIQENPNTEAQAMLENAIRDREKALQFYREENFKMAVITYRQAHYEVQKAIDIVKNKNTSIRDEAKNEAKNFENLLVKAKPIIAEEKKSLSERNYNSAIKLSVKADKAIADGEYRLGIDYYQQATRLILRAINLSKNKSDKTAQRAYEEVTSLDELIENFQQRTKLIENEERIILLNQRINQLQTDAHNSLEAGDFERTILNTQLARELIERAVKKRKDINFEVLNMIGQELNQLEIDIQDVENRVKQTGNEEAEILIHYAKRTLNRIQNMVANKNLKNIRDVFLTANAFTFAADRLIRSGQRDELSKNEINQKIISIEEQLKNINLNEDKNAHQNDKFLIVHIGTILNFAKENYEKNYLNVANECISIGERLLQKFD